MANVSAYVKPFVNPVDYLAALRQELDDLEPKLFVTLVFNGTTTLKRALELLDTFHVKVDRKILKREWIGNKQRRSRFIAVAENVNTNLHLHIALVPADNNGRKFWQEARAIWRDLAKAGNVDISQVRYKQGLIDYMLKQVRPETSEHIHYSQDYGVGRKPGR